MAKEENSKSIGSGIFQFTGEISGDKLPNEIAALIGKKKAPYAIKAAAGITKSSTPKKFWKSKEDQNHPDDRKEVEKDIQGRSRNVLPRDVSTTSSSASTSFSDNKVIGFGRNIQETPVKKNSKKPSSSLISFKKDNLSEVENLERELIAKFGSIKKLEAMDDDDDDSNDDDKKNRNKKKLGSLRDTNVIAKDKSKGLETNSLRQKDESGIEDIDDFIQNEQENRANSKRGSISAAKSGYNAKRENKWHNAVFDEEDDIDSDEYDGDYSEREGDLAAADAGEDKDNSFRLRKPPPPDPKAVALKIAKEKVAQEKKEAIDKKKALDRANSKTAFLPFDFEVEDEELLQDTLDKLFTEKSFEELGIDHPSVLENLSKLKVQIPTKIQEASIPLLLQRKNVVIQAQTGSGKTLAYLLPLLKTIDASKGKIQAIVLAPSRELVTQIGRVAAALFEGSGLRVVTLIGGANVKNQISHLRDDRPQIVVASPGRLAEIVFKLEKIRLNNVRVVIIDEVDNLLQEPYVGEIKTLLDATPLLAKERGRQRGEEAAAGDDEEEQQQQERDAAGSVGREGEPSGATTTLCLASATASSDSSVSAFADEYCLGGWTTASLPSSAMLPSSVTHGIISCPRIKAFEMLKKLLNAKPSINRALIFVNDPHRVEIVVDKLLEMGIVAAPLHGDASKDDRKEVIARITDGRLRFVVSTELAARGLDIPDLSHVINFELPTDASHYVHRTGRCGRAGRQGLVMNFATPSTKFVIRRFGKKLGKKIFDCEIREGQVFLKKE